MSKPTTSEYGRAPRSFGPADRLVYAIVPKALSANAKLYEAGRVSNDGKSALICALDADPDKPTPPDAENAWQWISVDEARRIMQTDPNWTTEDTAQ